MESAEANEWYKMVRGPDKATALFLIPPQHTHAFASIGNRLAGLPSAGLN